MKKFTILALALILCLGTLAQGPQPGDRRGAKPPFSPEEFRHKMTNFIVSEAGLTPTEASAFFPIFDEFKQKQREIFQKTMRLKQPKPEEKSVNYEQKVMQIAALDKQAATLEATYYKRLCKAVPAKKVYKALIAEDRFHRQMLGQFNMGPGHKGPQDGKGPRGPRQDQSKK